MPTKEIIVYNLEQTNKLATQIAKLCDLNTVILLNGDLGSGKTTFTQFLINAINQETMDVTSPTFSIMQTYDTKSHPVSHLDFYRLKDISELEEIGLEEILGSSVTIIEWPSILDISHLLKSLDVININIELLSDTNHRQFIITGFVIQKLDIAKD